jgi:60 kDa SS-A/Ro ribonucleoprotein
MNDYKRHAQATSTRVTPQSQSLPGQVPNNAGGYAYSLDDFERLARFLILGFDGGTFYIQEQDLRQQNTEVIDRCAAANPERTVRTIVEISTQGRAPRQSPAIFALARLSGNPNLVVRKAALNALNQVCRIGTHQFEFLGCVEHFRGWGRSLKAAVGEWYLSRDPRTLAYQITKYQQRGGETHRDALRRAHPKTADPDLNEVLAYATGKLVNSGTAATDNPGHVVVQAGDNWGTWLNHGKPHQQLLAAVEQAKSASTERQIVKLIRDHDLVRECIPTKWLNKAKVWDALFEKMPLGAMIRNLGKMTNVGLITPMSAVARETAVRLQDAEMLHTARIHPFGVLLALTTYRQGCGVRGSLKWEPVAEVSTALDECYYKSFKTIVPTGKNWMLGLDVSSSMRGGTIANSHIEPRIGAAAMAMVTARTEENYVIRAFAHNFIPLDITAADSLDSVVSKTHMLPFGRTDCALPMVWATETRTPVDVFAIYTDSETWYGHIHPVQALQLQQYRERMGRPAKLIVVGMVANQVTIADPNDRGMLDVVGFDANAPAVMADFARQ